MQTLTLKHLGNFTELFSVLFILLCDIGNIIRINYNSIQKGTTAMSMNRPYIPDSEFKDRARRLQQIMKRENVDILLAYGNEAEPQYARYLCDYWPSFESTGVLLAQQGDPILLIGPESYTFAADRSRIPEIRRLAAFRESSNPEYPGERLETFAEVIAELGVKPRTVAIAGYTLIPYTTLMELKASLDVYGDVQIVRGDEMELELRMIKSDNEIACMRHAGAITAKAMDDVIAKIEPGMTELQVRGIACESIYRNGAENESYPMWVLTGTGGNQAISRARHKVIEKNDAVFLQIGARYEGYASTIGRTVFFGEGHEELIGAVKAGYEAQEAIRQQLYAGNNAKNVADVYYEVYRRTGYIDWLLYGPCHGNGLMEGEAPWIESNSDYLLKENMTFCACLFTGNNKLGIGTRVEDTMRVGKDAGECMTHYPREIFRK